MGFGTIAANLIMFITVVMLAGSVVVLIDAYTHDLSASLNVQKDRMQDEIKSDITITSASYANGTITTVYVRNTGKTKLELNATDVYIDGYRFGHGTRNISVEADTEVNNPRIWDPKEIIKMQVDNNLTTGTHTIRVVAANGVSDEEQISN